MNAAKNIQYFTYDRSKARDLESIASRCEYSHFGQVYSGIHAMRCRGTFRAKTLRDSRYTIIFISYKVNGVKVLCGHMTIFFRWENHGYVRNLKLGWARDFLSNGRQRHIFRSESRNMLVYLENTRRVGFFFCSGREDSGY